jgi:Arc/MetJ-type ribon-helix-helix transcriptional regulator
MGIVQARLDEEDQAILDRLMRRTGSSASALIREGLRLVAKQQKAYPKKKIIGLGEFDAGPSDLSTNKKYLEGFGR